MERAPEWSHGILDSGELLGAVASLPEQLLDCTRRARLVEAGALASAGSRCRQGSSGETRSGGAFRSIVVLGVGLDVFAGELLRAVGAPVLEIPVVVVHGGTLPEFVDESTLVIAVAGTSGGEALTPSPPETVEAAAGAVERGAALVVVAGPGALAELAVGSGSVLYALEAGNATRDALGAVVAPVIVVCEQLGLLPGAGGALEAAAAALAVRRDALLRPDGGVARAIARGIGRTFPVIHGGEGIGVVAARRWAGQIAMTAKTQAFAGAEPDRSAVGIAGYGQAGDVTRQLVTLVALRTDFEGAHVAQRFMLAQEYATEAVASIVTVRATGADALTQLLDLALIGDFVAIHLALAEGLDPRPVPVNDDIAGRLVQLV